MNLQIIGACSDLGLTTCGAELGPKKMLKNIKDNNIIFVDKPECIKNTDKENLMKNLKEVNMFNNELFNKAKQSLQNNKKTIVIGGDHSIAIASALASNEAKKNIGIIWIDAHLDYNTFKTTITGNLHGLPLAAINGLCKELTPFANNYINPKNTVVVGYRAKEVNKDLEINNIIASGGTFFTDEDIKQYGIEYIMQKAFEIALKNTNGVHISYDLDVIDPIISPGVSVKEKDGLSYNEAIKVANIIKDNFHNITSFDLVEYNPLKDKDNKTLNIALEILNTIKK